MLIGAEYPSGQKVYFDPYDIRKLEQVVNGVDLGFDCTRVHVKEESFVIKGKVEDIADKVNNLGRYW